MKIEGQKYCPQNGPFTCSRVGLSVRLEHTSPTRGYDTFKKKSGLVGVDGEERGERREGSKSWARSVSDFLHSVSNQTFSPISYSPQQQGKTITRQPGIGGVKTTEVTNQGCVTSSSSNSKNHRITLSHYGAATQQPTCLGENASYFTTSTLILLSPMLHHGRGRGSHPQACNYSVGVNT